LEEILRTSFRLPADLMERLKWACLTRKTNQTNAVIAGLELWLDEVAVADRYSTATPEKVVPTTLSGNSDGSELTVIWNRAQAADPLLAAKLIEALQLVGNSSARPDSMANRPSGVDALAAAKAATEALGRETRAAQELVARTTKGHGSSNDVAPGPRRLKTK
jgi:hypothetical protein